MKTAVVMGTRPEIIKLSPIIRLLSKKSTPIIFTGQHYDHKMGMRFIGQLGIGKPGYILKIPRREPASQIAEMIKKIAVILREEKPDTVMVQGDTNTVLAAGLASLKSGIPISHVEAGLRSNDWRMPEEHNRIAVDHISELLFAPTRESSRNLLSENVHGRTFVTGNTVIDAVNQFAKISGKKSGLAMNFGDYTLVTIHRSENVDSRQTLSSIMAGIIDSGQDFVFPVHPHTARRLHEFGLQSELKKHPKIRMIAATGYFEMLELMKNCRYIVTDSGGIQEEATASSIRKKVIVVRKTTDRPEAVTDGFSEIAGTERNGILKCLKKTAKNHSVPRKHSPYGKGDAAKKIVRHLRNMTK